MADIGYVRSQLAGISDEKTRRIFVTIFEHVLGNLRFGDIDHQARATNFQAYYENSTTSSTSNTEFSIAHGLNATPHVAIQVLDLQAAGSQMVPLTVSRVADTKRLYLKSSSTNAPFTLLIE